MIFLVGDFVVVSGNDYKYEGVIRSIFEKSSGEKRAVVEDDNGRLFIHNLKQLQNKGRER